MTTHNTMSIEEFKERQQTVMLEGIVGEPVKVNYTDVGSGTPIILLHGIPTWSYLYQDTIQELEEDYRVIAPDLLGYGFSDQRDQFNRSLNIQADMVVKLMDELGLEKANVVAHDIGGGVGLILAHNEPERVNKLVLSNAVAYDSWPIHDMLVMGHPSRANDSLEEIENFLTGAYKQMFFNKENLTETFLQGIKAPYLHEEGKVSLVRNAAALNTNETTALTPTLSSIQQPVLLLWGEKDVWQPIETAEKLENDLPNSTLVRVEASHWTPQDAPEVFTAEIKKFI
ncbi:alpha/beta hydrolase [Pontibacillus halophilus JSM 076056 = DSM 19796]|uniref:Alpha/beta hydrolase n=1 Tax=Pontibacillus halophilus JSM 076056 = DSM 19796 TaxID=1385510 RepID=A0A0A5GH51_9BACI|nr:alpha/beta hydrolase [Pontibacillus halophilus]KGX92566.1 alpha/beta hydrolase [Pontibacillus halophilus JSM 076056 = DSM 19796]